jgi:hypothetical protein
VYKCVAECTWVKGLRPDLVFAAGSHLVTMVCMEFKAAGPRLTLADMLRTCTAQLSLPRLHTYSYLRRVQNHIVRFLYLYDMLKHFSPL